MEISALFFYRVLLGVTMLYAGIAVHFILQDGIKGNSRTFIAILVCHFGWSMSISQMQLSKDLSHALMLRTIGVVFWIMIFPFLISALLNIANSSIKKNLLTNTVIFAPALIASYVVVFIFPFQESSMQASKYGWINIIAPSTSFFREHYLVFYYAPYLIVAAAILMNMIASPKLKRHRRIAQILLASMVTEAILSTGFDIALPLFGVVVPSIGPAFGIIPAVAIVYVMRNYGFLSIDAKDVFNKVVDKMHDGVLIVDSDRKVSYINSVAQSYLNDDMKRLILGFDWETFLRGIELYDEDTGKGGLDQDSSGAMRVNLEKYGTSENKYFIYSDTTIRDIFGDVMGELILLKDITELREAQNEITVAKNYLEKQVDLRTGALLDKTSELTIQNERLEREITTRRAMQDKIERLAFYDTLTNLYI